MHKRAQSIVQARNTDWLLYNAWKDNELSDNTAQVSLITQYWQALTMDGFLLEHAGSTQHQ